MTVFKNLIGQRINGMFIDDDYRTILFRTVNGKYFQFHTQNDCCNSVWINHISGVHCVGDSNNSFDLLRGALVTDAEDKGWTPNRYDEDEHEAVQDGFWTIHTDRGHIDLEVRNSHNGYYGGSLEESNENEEMDPQHFKQLTEDF
jgi:hypothetical protein